MTLQTPQTRRFISNARMAAKSHPCASCGGLISKGEMHFVRPERVGRRLHSRHEHYLCPIPAPWAPEGMANTFRSSPSNTVQYMPRRKRTDFVTPVIIVLLGLMIAALIAAKYWSPQS